VTIERLTWGGRIAVTRGFGQPKSPASRCPKPLFGLKIGHLQEAPAGGSTADVV
jgi:hypothetical protein